MQEHIHRCETRRNTCLKKGIQQGKRITEDNGGMNEVYIYTYMCVYGIVNKSVSNVLKIMSKKQTEEIFENISDIGTVKEYLQIHRYLEDKKSYSGNETQV